MCSAEHLILVLFFQLRRELQAQAAGIQFVSAKDLRKDYGEPETEASDDDSRPVDPAEDPQLIVYRKVGGVHSNNKYW